MKIRICDWCQRRIEDGDAMPIGGGSIGGSLGIDVTAYRGTMRFVLSLGPVSINNVSNSHDLHQRCVQLIAAQGSLVDKGPLPPAASPSVIDFGPTA